MKFIETPGNFLKFVVLGLLFINIVAWLAVYQEVRPRQLAVYFFDVGQGDAILIETALRHQILIDGGPDDSIARKLAKTMPFWDRTLDLIILTHPQKDHIAGLNEVLKRYKVANILWTGVIADTKVFKEWQQRIEQERAKVFLASQDQQIKAGQARMLVLHPFEVVANQKFRDPNESSIVARLDYGGDSFLFTGDIPAKVERQLVEQGIELNSDVLKVSHHGSKTSSSFEFLEKALPKIAVIQVGANTFGHPNEEVIERLHNSGALVLRTDQQGDIVIQSNGKYVLVKNLESTMGF